MDQAEFQRTFDLPFKEASQFFRDKLSIPTRAWNDLWEDQHAKGYMVAGANKAELVADFRGACQQAIDGKMSLKDFQGQFDQIVARHGWSYNGSRNWRSELIWDTNTRMAYQAGRWQQLTAPGPTTLPYLTYHHSDGVLHPRPEHVAWDGITLPPDDPWWQTHYPPNGWRCHCTVFGASKDEYRAAIASGKGTAPEVVIDPKTGPPVGIDQGFAYNVGQAASKSYQILGNKFEQLPNDIARSWMAEHVQGPAFERFIEGKIEGEFPVAVLNPQDMEALGTEAQTVWMSQETLLKNKGDQPTRSAGHPELTLADYRMIPEIIDQGEVYQRNDEKLIYLLKGERVYRAVLKKTKDGSENYFLSLFSGSDEAKAMRQVAAKYEKIR